MLYVFVSGATAHKVWLDVQKEMYRVTACRNIHDRLEALVCMLEQLASGSNADRPHAMFIL